MSVCDLLSDIMTLFLTWFMNSLPKQCSVYTFIWITFYRGTNSTTILTILPLKCTILWGNLKKKTVKKNHFPGFQPVANSIYFFYVYYWSCDSIWFWFTIANKTKFKKNDSQFVNCFPKWKVLVFKSLDLKETGLF